MAVTSTVNVSCKIEQRLVLRRNMVSAAAMHEDCMAVERIGSGDSSPLLGICSIRKHSLVATK